MRIIPLIVFSFILSFYIFVITPLTIYLGNIDEFILAIWALLKISIKPILFLACTLVLIGCLLPKSFLQRYVTFIAMLSILFWIQGSIFVWDYGQLDGKSIDWNNGQWRGIVDLSIWILLTVAVFFLPLKTTRLIMRFAIAIFLIQAASATASIYQSSEKLHSKPMEIAPHDGESEMYRFSAEKNVLHIIADGFQSDIFEEIINSPEDDNPYRNAMSGFTFFRDHLGAFPLTHMAIPAIFSGRIYKNHMKRSEFFDSTLGSHSLLNSVYENDYEVDMTVPSSLKHIYMRSKHTNAYMISSNHHVKQVDILTDEYSKLIDLALFRLAPHHLKRHIYNDQSWLIQPFLINAETRGLRFFSHNAFLDDMTEKMSADRPRPVYKLLHLVLSHNPMVTTNQCNYAGKVLPTIRENVLNQARCSLYNILELFDRMKQLGIYHKSTIVLMADHGAFVPPAGFKNTRTSNGTLVIIDPITVAMALPLMAIKPAGESGPLKVSGAQTEIADTASTISSLMELDSKFNGTSFFSLNQNMTRIRKHYSYKYHRREWTRDYLAPIEEFIITGSILDSASWRLGNRYPPEGAVMHKGNSIN